MDPSLDHATLEAALTHCGASWDAAQTHGLLTGRLAAGGAGSGFDWLEQVLEGAAESDAGRQTCERLLNQLFERTYQQLAERQSEFEPLLPDDAENMPLRTAALGHWCEGFLHGLVSATQSESIKKKLAAEPLAEIIKDVLQLTRSGAVETMDEQADEAAFVEIVEYLRVVAQLTYEELAAVRDDDSRGVPAADTVH